MKKDAYYFPHFSNARNDSKLVKLRRVMGIEGYGMYFLILEVLREQTDFKLPISNLEDLAYEWHTSREKLVAVVTNFDLFTILEDKFVSIKLISYLQPYLEKSERARLAANKRWSNANAYANALPEHSKSNASKVKESKGKESKVTKKVFSKPSVEDIKIYCKERNNSVNTSTFFDHYESNGWKVGKNSMKDWKAAVRKWEHSDYNNNSVPLDKSKPLKI
jgi:hypothetical protein